MAHFLRPHRLKKLRLWKKRRLTLTGLLVLVGILVVPTILTQISIDRHRSASFYFQRLDGGTIYPGLVFTVELRVRTQNQSINAVSSQVVFDPAQLDVLGITTEDSFCSLYADNSFDTMKGEVTVSCGSPNPGFTGDSPIVAMRLRAKLPGTAQLTLNPKEAFALANNGKGTDILSRPLPTYPVTIKQTF